MNDNVRNIFEDEMNIKILQQRIKDRDAEIEKIIEASTKALQTATLRIQQLEKEIKLLKNEFKTRITLRELHKTEGAS